MMRYSRRFIDPRHQYRRWVDPRVKTLRLADVIAYLESRGWKQVPTDRKHSLVFQEPTVGPTDGEPFYQFVPDSEDYDTYGLLMFDLLTGLAEFEDRQASAVIDDIVGSAARNGAPAGTGREETA